MKEQSLSWIESITTWAKTNNAENLTSTAFTILGWSISKLEILMTVLVCLAIGVPLLIILNGIFSTDKLDNEPRKRPGMD